MDGTTLSRDVRFFDCSFRSVSRIDHDAPAARARDASAQLCVLLFLVVAQEHVTVINLAVHLDDVHRAAIEDRAVPGHWEGDLLSGSKNSYIATLVERHTRYVMLAKVANKDTQTVVSALIKQVKTLPNELYKSLTWDRGKELAYHRRFTLATNIDVYFCDPQSQPR